MVHSSVSVGVGIDRMHGEAEASAESLQGTMGSSLFHTGKGLVHGIVLPFLFHHVPLPVPMFGTRVQSLVQKVH